MPKLDPRIRFRYYPAYGRMPGRRKARDQDRKMASFTRGRDAFVVGGNSYMAGSSSPRRADALVRRR